ncbi:MarR family winged helix-turn-helix transcriptional regulator [Glycomyces harbinensis]|uniref:DNA-binding transcriptional regulator, MarR family n=1 Tax=Glycomyces harbinensis TaxID=58114 RepID=A0A1G6V9T1_9ACTN|nr:MarR family transcriptional regulator [Glycomyces harbinensis]SDD50271.1 DNA-binding transcriptional regulator, MarR family [Glycomyces harbinensis]
MEAGSDNDVCAKWSETLRVYHTTSVELENELQARHDLGLSEFEVLSKLSKSCGGAGGKARMKELEAEMYLSQSALSRTVTRLEKAGLVARATCDFDRRANFLMLTPAGQERFVAAQPTHRGVLLNHLG